MTPALLLGPASPGEHPHAPARAPRHHPTRARRRCPWEAPGLDSDCPPSLPVTLRRPRHQVSPEQMLPEGNHSEPHIFHTPTAARDRAPHSPRTSDTPSPPASQQLIPEPRAAQPEPQTRGSRSLQGPCRKRLRALSRLSRRSQGLGEAAPPAAVSTRAPAGCGALEATVSSKALPPARVGTDVLTLGDRVWAHREIPRLGGGSRFK